jgi:predicted secreted protein
MTAWNELPPARLTAAHRLGRLRAAASPGIRALCGLAMGLSLLAQQSQAQNAPELRRNLVSLSHSATQEVTQDLLTVTLQVMKEGTSAADVQTALKKLLDASLTEARQAAQPGAMDVRTGVFSIHPRYSNQGKINGWQGQAQLVLEGQDMARIAQTVGRIEGMTVNNVGYGLSRALRDKSASALTAQAIEGFKAHAMDVSKAFGFKGFALVEVNVQKGEPGFEPRMAPMMLRAASADAAPAPLPVEPGKGVVTVSVSGQVVLTP